jgi:hypothetical protein
LPRLARKIRIIDSHNEVVNYVDEDEPVDPRKLIPSTPTSAQTNLVGDAAFQTASPTEPVEQKDEGLSRTIFSILQSLGQELHDHSHASINGMNLEMFERECSISDFKSINNFLLRHFGTNGRATKVLKACNQSIIAPPVTTLKKLLMDKADYKDVKGQWQINVHVETKVRGKGDDEQEDVFVVVRHRKKEQVLEKKKMNYELVYQFEWEFTIRFKPNLEDIESISLGFKDILFNGKEMTDTQKKDIESMLRSVILDLEVPYDEAFFKRIEKSAKKK